mgnify:CR=1 FL=1
MRAGLTVKLFAGYLLVFLFVVALGIVAIDALLDADSSIASLVDSIEVREDVAALETDIAQARSDLAASRLRVFVFVGLAATGVVVLTLVSLRLISKPVSTVVSGVEDIVRGEGDLTRRVSVRTKDEVGDLSRSVNVFIARLHDMISRLKSVAFASGTVSEELASSAEQISSTLEEMQAVINQISRRADTLSQGAASVDESVSGIREAVATVSSRIEEQSSAVSESSAAIQEMIASIGAMSTTTASRRELIVSLRSGAEEGTEAMSDAMDAMNDVSGRWAYDRQIYGHVFAARLGALGDLAAFGNGRNDPHATVLGLRASPTPAFEIA